MRIPLLLLAVLACALCLQAQHSIIPQPLSYTETGEDFILNEQVSLAGADSADYFLLKQIMMRTTFWLSTQPTGRVIAFKNDVVLGKEAYRVKVHKDSVVIAASSPAGKCYALQTLMQLYNDSTGVIKGCIIEDEPQYPYRAMHLDICRHFFGKAVIKKYIALLGALKMNTLHLHLTDDQGWRIEIKKYPKLTEVGAWRTEKDGSRYGGYLTQEDLKELVAFAAQCQVNIIPEIEIPGHSSAAITAYPFLSCHGEQIAIPTTWGIKRDIYCPTDSTINFLKDVLDEVCEIFPSKYIHIGGDEAPKAQWRASAYVKQLKKDKGWKNYEQVQSYFMQQIESHLAAKGRISIGWGEVMRGGAGKNMVVMSWLSKAAGIKALKQGNAVIMAPRFYCYFDYPQSSKDKLHAIWMTPLPLKKVYALNPGGKYVTPQNKHLLLGGEAAVWTEFIKDEKQLQYQIMPRIAAMSEALWSKEKNYEDFIRRLKKNYN